MPRKPARRKITREIMNLFSVKIKYNDEKIRMYGMKNVIDLKSVGRKNVKIGVMTREITTPARQP